MTTAEFIVCEMLNCGYLDIAVLDDVDDEWMSECLEEIKSMDHYDFNTLMASIFLKAVSYIEDKLTEAQYDAEQELEDMAEMDDESFEYQEASEKVDALYKLKPEEDIEWYCNCLDSSIYLVKNEELWRKYGADVLSEAEDKLGMDIGG